MEPEEQQRYDAFELAFRELFVRDLEHADAGDVRMGTFILCTAFLDALSLTYSAGLKIPNGKAGKWKRFLCDYLGAAYEPIWDSYNSLRNRLLHNYGALGIAFTHAPENAHLHLNSVGRGMVVLHRESFVRDVVQAFEGFASDVHSDPELRRRAFKHFDRYPPMGLAHVNWA